MSRLVGGIPPFHICLNLVGGRPGASTICEGDLPDPSSVIIPHYPARTNCAVEVHQPLMGNSVKTCALSPITLVVAGPVVDLD
jgi:hypothetical protein